MFFYHITNRKFTFQEVSFGYSFKLEETVGNWKKTSLLPTRSKYYRIAMTPFEERWTCFFHHFCTGQPRDFFSIFYMYICLPFWRQIMKTGDRVKLQKISLNTRHNHFVNLRNTNNFVSWTFRFKNWCRTELTKFINPDQRN